MLRNCVLSSWKARTREREKRLIREKGMVQTSQATIGMNTQSPTMVFRNPASDALNSSAIPAAPASAYPAQTQARKQRQQKSMARLCTVPLGIALAWVLSAR